MSLYVDIEKKYKDFSLKVKFETQGGILGILGASGCGKSMTLKCIAGIVNPERGKIVLNGRTLFDSEKKINLKPQKRRVGYLFQDYALFPNKTVEGNITCAVKGDKKAALKKWISLFQLEGLEKKYPHQLSGGQKQRTALARMLASEPELLLLDEPFSALDSHLKEMLQMEMLELLKKINRDMLLVSHSRDEVYRLCPDLLVLDQGRKVCMGQTREIFKEPGFLEAARLTGCKNFSRIRRLDSRQVKAEDWGIVLRTAGEVTEDSSYAGIRAHYFRPAQKSEENAFPVELAEAVESPFEMYVIFRVKGEGETKPVWWKLSKEEWHQELGEKMPEYLKVDPADVMILKEMDQQA